MTLSFEEKEKQGKDKSQGKGMPNSHAQVQIEPGQSKQIKKEKLRKALGRLSLVAGIVLLLMIVIAKIQEAESTVSEKDWGVEVLGAQDVITLKVKNEFGENELIRLYGIVPSQKQGQSGQATEFIQNNVVGESVQLDVYEVSRRSGTVAIVHYTEEGTGKMKNLNKELVKRGKAEVSTWTCRIEECAEWQRIQILAERERQEG